MDPDKMADKIKKLAMSADLSQQRCVKYEARIKELEGKVHQILTPYFCYGVLINIRKDIRI